MSCLLTSQSHKTLVCAVDFDIFCTILISLSFFKKLITIYCLKNNPSVLFPPILLWLSRETLAQCRVLSPTPKTLVLTLQQALWVMLMQATHAQGGK